MSATSEAPVVSVRPLRKQFRREDGTLVPAIASANLEVGRNEVLVLLGPSGCGKTTLLRAIAGLERPDGGSIVLHGEPAFDADRGIDLPPEARRISMIFQSYALWPHMSAAENVAYPLRSRGTPRMDIDGRVREALLLVGVGDLGGQYPGQMSGGQQQRVALARAIVARDELVLFDEPLSNVDAKVRQQLRLELLTMQRRLGFSAVYVTHDQIEAMALAHRIAVLRSGVVEQIGTPQEIYDRPISRYVANFIGTTNEVPGRVVGREPDGSVAVETALGRFVVRSAERGSELGQEVCILVRPEHCTVTTTQPDGALAWPGTVVTSVFLGPYTEDVIRIGELLLQVWSRPTAPLTRDGAVWVVPDSAWLRLVSA